MIYSAVVAMLVMSSCSSAYKTAQTPDDVYYSPSKPVYASNNARTQTQQATNNQETDQDSERYVTYDDNGRTTDTYVTYEDGDEEKYDYARRLDRFNRPYSGSYWDNYAYDDFYYGSPSFYNSYYSPFNNPYGMYGNGFFSPFRSSIGLSIGWGSYYPYGGGFGYSPWYGGFYNSYYPSYYYGGGYYGGYYPGNGHIGGGNYQPRPSNSWGPRGSSSSVIYGNNNGRISSGSGNTGSTGGVPVRTFDRSSSSNGNSGGYTPSNAGVPRRTFDRSSSERPVTSPSRPANSQPTRTFDRSSSNNSSNQPSYTPPTRSYSPPASTPSNSGSSSSGSNSSAPVRSGRRG